LVVVGNLLTCVALVYLYFCYNKLQFLLHAQSQHFVSCTGGSAVIASYFGGTNIVVTNYKDPTRAVGGYFSAFANTNVVLVQYEKDLLEKMNELF